MTYKAAYPFIYIPERRSATPPGSRQYESTRRESNASPAGGVVPVLYGQRRIPGLFVSMAVVAGKLNVTYLLCEGPIQAIDYVYIDDKLSTEYGASITVTKYLGSAAQAAPYTRIAYITLSISPLSTITSLPSVEAICKGRKVYDPRLDSTNGGTGTHRLADETTWAYSKNPALHLADLMINQVFGGRIATTKISWPTVITAAGRCDDSVAPPAWTPLSDVVLGQCCINDSGKTYICNIAGTTAAAGGPTGTGGNIIDGSAHWAYTAVSQAKPRHELNYYWGEQTTLQDAIECIKRHCLGVVLFDSGLYEIKIQQPYTGTPETFTEDDVWDVEVLEIQSQDLINRVAWTWTDPTTWEAVDEYLEDPGLAATDEIHEATYDFTGCTTRTHGKRLGIFNFNARLSDLPVQFKVFNARGLQPLDVFYLIHSVGGWTAPGKLFQVMSVEPQPECTIILAREYDPAAYADHVVEDPTYSDTSLPLPDDVPEPPTAPVISLTADYQVGSMVVPISWTASATSIIGYYEIEWRLSLTDPWTLIGRTTGQECNYTYTQFPGKAQDHYYFRIFTVSIWGIRSATALSTDYVRPSVECPMPKPGTTITATPNNGNVLITWARSDGSRPFYAAGLTGSNLEGPVRFIVARRDLTESYMFEHYLGNGMDITSFVDRPGPGTYKYSLIAVSLFGEFSIGAWFETAAVTVTEVSVQRLAFGDATQGLTSDAALAYDPATKVVSVNSKALTNVDHNHTSGNGAAITEAALTLADNTTANVSTAKHGFCPKLPNDATKALDGSGAWAVFLKSGGALGTPSSGTLTNCTSATPAVDDNSTALATTAFACLQDKLGNASISASPGNITNTEVLIVKTPALAANRLAVGTVIRISLRGTFASSANGTCTFYVKLGTNGTTADAAIATYAAGTVNSSTVYHEYDVEIMLTVTAVGASGTAVARCTILNTAQTVAINAAPVRLGTMTMAAFNTTTANNILSVTAKNSANTATLTVSQALIEIAHK